MASALRPPRCGQPRRESSTARRAERMMREHRSLSVWPSLIAAGLLAVACSDQPNVSMAPKRPSFWVTPPPAQCPTGKWTGGGRIDPPSNHEATDEEAVYEGQVFAGVVPTMTGEVTFRVNVFFGPEVGNGQPTGNCNVTKGRSEVNRRALVT